MEAQVKIVETRFRHERGNGNTSLIPLMAYWRRKLRGAYRTKQKHHIGQFIHWFPQQQQKCIWPTPRQISTWNENLFSHWNLYCIFIAVLSITTQTKTPPNVLLLWNKQTAAHPYERALLYKHEQNIDTCYIQHGWISNALCKLKQDTLKGHMLYDSIYTKFWQKQTMSKKGRSVIVGVKAEKGLTTKGLRSVWVCECVSVWVYKCGGAGNGTALYLDCSAAFQLHICQNI